MSTKPILHQAPSSVSTKRQAHFAPSAKQRFLESPSDFYTRSQTAFPLSAKLTLHQAPSSVATERQADGAPNANHRFHQ
eukprot:3513571-Karenia_brevis.AAC.1